MSFTRMQSAPAENATIGYIVYEIRENVSQNNKFILHTSWDDAIAYAATLADSIAEKYSTKALCILRNTSQTTCISNGFTTSHRIHGIQSEIVIGAVRAAN